MAPRQSASRSGSAVAQRADRALARGACYACHSNETDWPAYSYVAPMSWFVRNDVEAGREELNFSEWGPGGDVGDAAAAVADNSMPPRRYTVMHTDARLTDEERRELIAALEAMDEEGGGDGENRGRGRGRGRGGNS